MYYKGESIKLNLLTVVSLYYYYELAARCFDIRNSPAITESYFGVPRPGITSTNASRFKLWKKAIDWRLCHIPQVLGLTTWCNVLSHLSFVHLFIKSPKLMINALSIWGTSTHSIGDVSFATCNPGPPDLRIVCRSK